MKKYLLAVAVVMSLFAGFSHAWWIKGHETIADAATVGLPDEAPAFFRAGGKAMAHYSGDPDRWKNPAAKHLRAAESPDHFLDLEDYEGKELPANRYKAIAMLIEMKKDPEHVGMLPYAIMENYDRLRCAFYDYRADPENKAAQAKCLVYAGNLAHFTGDCVMPLHTTIHFDGRKIDGKVKQKGIHARIDGFPEKNNITAEEMARGLKAKAIDDMWAYVLKTIKESHEKIDKCYELDEAGAIEKPTDESRKFILERCQAGTQFTMDVWYTAWLQSAKMPKPY